MFKDNYKNANDKIKMPAETKKYIRSKLAKGEYKPFRINKNGIASVCLTLALVLGVVLLSGNTPTVLKNGGFEGPKALVTKLTYDDLYNTITALFEERKENSYIAYTTGTMLDAGMARDDMEIAPEESVNDTDSLKGTSSTTNNQVEGVEEADIVKNDGRYIYTLTKGSFITIADSNNGTPVKVFEINVSNYGMQVKDFYVLNNRLAVIQQPYGYQQTSMITVYDVTDKENPKVMSNVKQSGYVASSRMVGNTIYLITNYTVESDQIHKDFPAQYVPCINGDPIPIKDISMVEGCEFPSYLVVTATDITTAKSTTGETVLGGGECFYADSDNLYYTFSEYNRKAKEGEYRSKTTVVKMALTPEDITTVASGEVDGTPLSQFSMDEYKGNFRIVTTVDVGKETQEKISADDGSVSSSVVSFTSTSENALFVLDEKMKVVGSIEKLAEGERVKSVRFSGDVGYFVTFRQTDPLFAVDLSEPENPTVLSALKIPGFSQYLHSYGEGLLFGFGMAATEEGFTTSLKLSMFDVSDPAKVSEKHTLPIEKLLWSSASYDHKAIMVDAEKNIIAFCGEGYMGNSSLMIYGYDREKGFLLKTEREVSINSSLGTRFVWIDDYFYAVNEFGITAFDLATFTESGKLEF